MKMMKAFKKRGALTHFQILSEISKQDPHLKQKDLAKKLGITIQAVSENIKTLTELGYITSKDGRSPYKITQSGIDKVKKDAISLRKYSDSVLETMNHYKTIWPAIAKEELKKDGKVALVGFGTMLVTKRDARQGRNPRTGKDIKIPAKKVVKFKPALNILK
jgi:putative transcriptional regulator